MKDLNTPSSSLPRIVLIGGGFAGLEFIRQIDHKKFQLVLIDKNNYHNFQPLLYQVAMSGLEPDSIAFPLRKFIKRYKNIYFRYTEVLGFDDERKEVETKAGTLSFDYLVIASGSRTNFFGKTQLQKNALSLKSVSDALDIRSLILQNLEKALLTSDDHERQSLMTIVISGAGPTGVELAGALSELKHYAFKNEYIDLNTNNIRIILIEGLDKVLHTMSKQASENTLKALRKKGVEVRLNTMISDYDGEKVEIEDSDPVYTQNMIWTAGVEGNPVAGPDRLKMVKGNRVKVNETNAVEGFENIFAIGDIAAIQNDDYPKGHPMLAQPAIQQARRLAKNLKRQDRGKPMKPFKYKDKGTMTTIGRSNAVVDLKGIKLNGFLAWIIWLVVHLVTLVGFKNKIFVLFDWFINYISYNNALRLIIRPYRGKS